METFFKAIMIPILLISNKIIMSLSYRDQIVWLVYITINNLNLKPRQNQTRLSILFCGSIPIIFKHLKDKNNKNPDLKVKIYYLTLTTIL